jgi:copper transport protein
MSSYGSLPPAGARGIRHAARGLLLALLVLLGAQVVGAPPVAAHAEVVSVEPVDGSRLSAVPATVVVAFDEAVEIGADALRTTTADGDPVGAGSSFHPDGDGRRVAQRLLTDLPAGGYRVTFGVVADDGHPVSGGFSFVVGAGPLPSLDGTLTGLRSTDPWTAAGYALARTVAFAGLAALGGLVFLLVCWPGGAADPRARRVLATGAAAITAGTLAALVLQGPYGAGRGPGAVLDPDLLAATLGLPVGKLLLLRLPALAVLAVLARLLLARPVVAPEAGERSGVRVSGSAAEAAGMGTALVLIATYAGAGHAGGGPQPTGLVLSTMLHLGAMAVWLGGLLMLGCALLRPRSGSAGPVAESAVSTFSPLAAGCVLVLVLTGAFQALLEIGAPAQLWTTAYGRLLVLKLAAVAVLLLAAAAGRRGLRRLVVPADVRGPMTAGRPGPAVALAEVNTGTLRRRVGAEVAVALVVLALSSVLTATAPARSADVGATSAGTPAATGIGRSHHLSEENR